MSRLSAGLLVYRRRGNEIEVLLVHMGGPFWSHKDAGAWSLPKGEYGADEEPLAAARREFAEELGLPAPGGRALDLGEIKQAGGKVVRAWALEGDIDTDAVQSNSFELEWPRGSGTVRSFPEVDRAAWFDLQSARAKLVKGQGGFLDRLSGLLG